MMTEYQLVRSSPRLSLAGVGLSEIIVETIKLEVQADREAILDTFSSLPDEIKQAVVGLYTFEDILGHIDRQLRHETDFNSWSTDGWIDSGRLRAALIKTQGIEPEFQKDLELKIRLLGTDVTHYKKYYDWYWRLYHASYRHDDDTSKDFYGWVKKAVGWL